MALRNEPYRFVVVESYKPLHTGGLHGEVHIRPVVGQDLSTTLHVECSKALSTDYPVGTRFRIKAKLTGRRGGGEFLYSYFGWRHEVLGKPDGA